MQPAPFFRIVKMNKPEWPYLLGGSTAGMINGLFPFAFALVLSEILNVSRKVLQGSIFIKPLVICTGN